MSKRGYVVVAGFEASLGALRSPFSLFKLIDIGCWIYTRRIVSDDPWLVVTDALAAQIERVCG